MTFLDNRTLSIQVEFDNTADISLNQDEEKLKVSLWGPFLSADNLQQISKENRT